MCFNHWRQGQSIVASRYISRGGDAESQKSGPRGTNGLCVVTTFEWCLVVAISVSVLPISAGFLAEVRS